MAETENAVQEVQVTDESGHSYVAENRRYVGRKETIGYVIWDMAQTFNIDGYSGRFVTNILQVDLQFQQIVTVVNGIWDIINDIFTGAIVDKTRTRWGKFKPYLVLLAGPGTFLRCIFWMLPLFFPNALPRSISKFIVYFALAIIREGVDTFTGIAQTGLISTITPHPVDRTRLITLANFFSGFLGEKLPDQIMTVLLDLIGNNVIKTADIQSLYVRIFVGMGVFTSIVSGSASLWFNTITKERVLQSVERPSIKQGIRSIITNKPILLLTLSDILGSFSLGGNKRDYFIDVLNFASLQIVVGIPGAVIHPISYTFVPKLRQRFSSRFLYIVYTLYADVLRFLVFLFGSIGGKHNGLYKKLGPMAVVLTLEDSLFMLSYGVRKVIPTEMTNESIDYCEWKNGYRTEAMTGIARGLTKKLSAIFINAISLKIKELIGYDLTLYTKGQKQSDDTQYWLFASYYAISIITGLLATLPMFFYDLDGKKKEKMYEELLERRKRMSAAATDGDPETLAKLAKEQMMIGEKNQAEQKKKKSENKKDK